VGGPIAAVEEGDIIEIDIEKRSINLVVPSEVVADRMKRWTPPAPHYETGVFAKYIATVSSASEGAVTFRPPALVAKA
jgi:dihydroxy-acid dehydratase